MFQNLRAVTSFFATLAAVLLIQSGVWYLFVSHGARSHIAQEVAVAVIFGTPSVIAAIAFGAWVRFAARPTLGIYAFAALGWASTILLSLLLLLPVGCAVQPANCL